MAAYASLKYRIAITIFVLQGVMMGLTLWHVLGGLDESVADQLAAQEQVTLDLLRGQSVQALVTEEFTELQPVLESLQQDRHIVRAMLLDSRGRVVAASNPGDLGRPLAELKAAPGNYLRQQEVGRANWRLGSLALEFSRAALVEASTAARNQGILIAGVSMLVIAVVGIGIGWLLTRRLDRLRVAAQKLASGDLSVRVGLDGHDEIATLGQTFDRMAERIASDQERLQRANVELEQRVEERTAELRHSLEELERTQGYLVQTEKLAALGSLVAGISHEINTPLGIGVTATSFLHEKALDIEAQLQAGTIKRSDLSAFIDTTLESTGMALTQLNRAADLIRSFKMVAVDQTSAKRREFALRETVEEILATLRHLVKSREIEVELALGEDLRMDSYPGPLGQVLTNLFNNALLHAFDEMQRGRIRIEARAPDAQSIELRFEDDGKGIPADSLGKIFDPFFTTRFGQGGSGLGLNIVHNLVTGVLGGRIRVQSHPGQGTTFIITLPRTAPPARQE
ncbi:MAG: ATP-binding protein [Hylemonella sp.]|nr:ATP-binding protein [Hylemonella sp.]